MRNKTSLLKYVFAFDKFLSYVCTTPKRVFEYIKQFRTGEMNGIE